MTIEFMRAKIREPYPYPGWQEKVDRMPTNQVVAVYKNFLRTGLFNKKHKKKREEAEKYHQMTIWDWMFELSEPVPEGNKDDNEPINDQRD